MTDLIDRMDAIKAIQAIDDHGNSDRANALGLAAWAIEMLPNAEPEQPAFRIKRKYCYQCDACGALVGLEDSFCRLCGRRLEYGCLSD